MPKILASGVKVRTLQTAISRQRVQIVSPSFQPMDDDSPQRHAAGKRRADRIIQSVTRDLIIASITVIVLVTLMMLA